MSALNTSQSPTVCKRVQTQAQKEYAFGNKLQSSVSLYNVSNYRTGR